VGKIAVRTWWLLLTLIGLMGSTWPRRGPALRNCRRRGGCATPAAVQEVKPSGIYLKNEKGELVYVPDVSYEQFEQMLKAQRNLTDAQQPAS